MKEDVLKIKNGDIVFIESRGRTVGRVVSEMVVCEGTGGVMFEVQTTHDKRFIPATELSTVGFSVKTTEGMNMDTRKTTYMTSIRVKRGCGHTKHVIGTTHENRWETNIDTESVKLYFKLASIDKIAYLVNCENPKLNQWIKVGS